MLFRNISISFCLSSVLTLIATSITRPHSVMFIPSFVLQSGTYAMMMLVALLLNKAFKLHEIGSFVIAFFVSYTILIFVLWDINGTKTAEAILALHTGRDFVGFLVPFILSNVIMGLWMCLKG